MECFSVVAAELKLRWNDHDGIWFGQYALGLSGSGSRRTDGTLSWGDAPARCRVCAVVCSGASRSLEPCRICFVFAALAGAPVKLDVAFLPSA